jgi:hypothetical protein
VTPTCDSNDIDAEIVVDPRIDNEVVRTPLQAVIVDCFVPYKFVRKSVL